MKMPIRISDPAGPAYPPKSVSSATSCENWKRTLVVSIATSTGDIFNCEFEWVK